MVELNDIKKIYFLGIGGIGMSALARYFHSQGKIVGGYDRTETTLTRSLVQEGIAVSFDDSAAAMQKDAGLIVYTPAIPLTHPGYVYYKENSYPLLKRSEVLGLITRSSTNICVAGTHGKTTISTMIAFLLRDTGYGCNAFLGGISSNYGTNFWSSPRNVCVVEADEYDRSFLRLSPDIAVISSMDADHLDIYGTAEAVTEAFTDFSRKIKDKGTLIVKKGLPLPKPANAAKISSYDLADADADILAQNIQIGDGGYRFDVRNEKVKLNGLELQIGGRHNIENALAAIGAVSVLGLDAESITVSLSRFKGVKRRFEKHIAVGPVVYIDDYAHHPRELEALLGSVKELYPDRYCIILFQPHLYSRTRDFAEGFAQSLDLADEAWLLPLYPARELPVEGVSSRSIEEKMKKALTAIVPKNEVLSKLQSLMPGRKTVFITAGAGDIDTLVGPVTELLTKSK